MRHLALLLLAACADPSADPDGPSFTETPVGDPVTATVGPDGGRIEAAADGVTWTLDVPGGALAAATEITVTPVALAELDGPVDGVATGVAFAPAGLQFAAPATLTAAGYAADGLALGLVWSDGGPVDWQAPGGEGDAWTIEVPHFSGGGLADFLPERWIEVLDALGALPEATLDPVADAPGVGETTRFACATVTNGAGRAQPNVPVRFALSGSDDELGFLSNADARTDASGKACVFWNSRGTPGPFGTLVELQAFVLEGAAFQLDVASRFQWGGEAPRVTLSGVVADEELKVGAAREVCATIAFDDGRPLGGYPVELTSFGSTFLPLAFQGTTSDAGRACASFTVPESESIDDDGELVDIAAVVRLGPGREAVDLRSVRVVEGALLSLVFSPALPERIAPGADPIDVCVDVTVNDTPVDAVTVNFAVAGEGTVQDAAVSGPNGRVCTRYQPPGTVPTSPDVISATATLGDRDGLVTHAITIADTPQPVDYDGTFVETFVHTRVDGLGRRMDGDGSGETHATFRMRRHPDGTWEALEVSGSFSQSYYEYCDMLETITFDTIHSLSEFQGRLTFFFSGPAMAVNGRRGTPAGCTLISLASANRGPPFAFLQPDGRYVGTHVASVMDPNGTFREESATVELIPQ